MRGKKLMNRNFTTKVLKLKPKLKIKQEFHKSRCNFFFAVTIICLNEALFQGRNQLDNIQQGTIGESHEIIREVASRRMSPTQKSNKVRDFPQFTPPNFSLRVSLLPKGVVLVDLEPDISLVEVQILNCDVEDVLTRGIMSSSHCINTPLTLGTFFFIVL
ncbi:hypothetical protein Cgig2_011961 [Carnegiea gigantea]|uniref:Uncharacterized protein n=1 Tax=Carnegiea gigantea TaxID=171969 RepID=A0A9Q1JIY6_9CARY|nr:hypothetical protein Cgig2_011961 [Carnegiea gigantea]